MPRKPDERTINAKNAKLDPVAVLEATINAMHDDELERKLVESGVAVYATEGK